LCEDAAELRRGLCGQGSAERPRSALLDDVSTDEIAPAWACYYIDETLGRFALTGLRGRVLKPGEVLESGASVLCAGRAFGRGSSREAAPLALRAAGIRIIVALGFERIFRQNCESQGLLVTTEMGVLEALMRGEPVERSLFTRGLDAVSSTIVESGGLLAYERRRAAGEVPTPVPRHDARSLTLAEKLIARRVLVDAASNTVGVPAVRPGDAVLLRADLGFSHDYTTSMVDALFRAGFGEAASLAEPERLAAFRDHLPFLERVMSPEHRSLGLIEPARALATRQREICAARGIRLFDERPASALTDPDGPSAYAIGHQCVLEELAWPGDVVVGTDSHTCTAGALGALAFGVGSSDMAALWGTGAVRFKVPPTLRVELEGHLRPWVCAKDLALWLLALPAVRNGDWIGRILEFGGPGLVALPMEERATLSNMAVEFGATTAVMEVDAETERYLSERRRSTPRPLRRLVADADAEYELRLVVDLARVEPMVALPGDPKRGQPLAELVRSAGPVAIHTAYGGSCTGGKRTDMEQYARVLGAALERGRRVKDGVRLYIQFASVAVREDAERAGYLDVFRRAGATLLEPACGACILAGPGISSSSSEVTVSAGNRNFPGRSGPGQVYLASPAVVAASAVLGQIASPAELFSAELAD
jgi:3-isopropylmalate/(R)-2-methylmalate dehydratase large subunit